MCGTVFLFLALCFLVVRREHREIHEVDIEIGIKIRFHLYAEEFVSLQNAAKKIYLSARDENERCKERGGERERKDKPLGAIQGHQTIITHLEGNPKH